MSKPKRLSPHLSRSSRSPHRKRSSSRSSQSSSIVRIPLKKGDLTKYGYAVSKSPVARHRALSKSIKNSRSKSLKVFRKLNALAILQKNTSPRNARVFNADKAWVKKTYM